MTDQTNGLRTRCASMLSILQRNAIMRQGSPVDDLMAFVVAETGRTADKALDAAAVERAAQGAYTVWRDGEGFAAAIERDGYTVLILAAGAERNEQEVERIVAELNRSSLSAR